MLNILHLEQKSILFKKIFLAVVLVAFTANVCLANSLNPVAAVSHANETSDTSSEDAEDELAKGIVVLGILACVGIGISYYWLNSVQFLDYPYQDTGEYYPGDKKLPGEGNYVMRGEFEDIFTHSDPGYCTNRFSIDTSFVWMNKIGLGAESRFEGLFFPYIGPYIENLAIYNIQKGEFHFNNKGFRDNIKLGGQLSLLQSNLLSANFIFSYTNWSSKSFEDFSNGINVGAVIRSYPIKPLTFEWKFGWQFYSSDFKIFESNLQAGIMMKNYEIFAAWKVLAFDYESDDFYQHFGNFYGFALGLRLHMNLGTNL